MRYSSIAAAGTAAILGACTNGMTAFEHSGNPLMQPYRVKQVEQTIPTGDAFSQALTAEYQALAAKEGDVWYDFFDSDFFAQKALRSAAGADVVPEDPGMWRVTSDDRRQLDPARARLMEALEGGRIAAPADAAKAQAAYDCWVEEQEEAWQTDQIAMCQTAFENALTALNAATAQPEPEPEPLALAPVPIPELPKFYTVFFGFDDTNLSPIGRAVLDQLILDWGDSSVPMDLIGHADRSGADLYNQRLSERRAQTVRSYLVEHGLDAGKLDASGVGESQPDIQTADGVREAKNRRVVIAIEAQ